MTDNRLKFLAALLLFAGWGYLVLFNGAPQDALIDALKMALAGLGVYHIGKGNTP